MASSAASTEPTFGCAWPCTSTRPSPHSSSAARRAASMTSAERGSGSPSTGMADSTAIVVSERLEHEVEPVGRVEARWPVAAGRLRERAAEAALVAIELEEVLLDVDDGLAIAAEDRGGHLRLGGRLRREVEGPRGRCSSSEQAPRANRVAAEAIVVRRKSRRDIPSRRAASSQVCRATCTARRTAGDGGGGANSPFEHGPSLMGSPGSSSRSRRRTSGDHIPIESGITPPADPHTAVARSCQYLSRSSRV